MGPYQTIEQWIDLYYGRLFGIAYTYVRNHHMAEDCVQTTYLKAFKSIGQLTGTNPFPWLAKILVNECLSYKRKASREYSTEYVPELSSPSSEDVYLRDHIQRTVHQAVLSLPVKYRMPIVLFYFYDLNYAEISAILGISIQSVKTRLHRARQRLMKVLKEGEMDGSGQPLELRKTAPENH
ncbi:MAG: RNA polymerase sigma factor [Alicyclobacillus sp.]|nr:RNA polymerase sigma factor [Alicyclobacillus sp.]